MLRLIRTDLKTGQDFGLENEYDLRPHKQARKIPQLKVARLNAFYTTL